MAELVALSVTMKGAGDEDLMRLRLPIRASWSVSV